MRGLLRGVFAVSLAIAVAAAGHVTSVSSQTKPAPRKLDLAYLLAPPESGAVGLKFMAEEVTRRSNGSVNMVFHGGTLLNKELVIRLLQHLDSETSYHEEPLLKQLTAREYEVLQLLAQGQTNPQIAGSLSISVSTVKIHVEHILSKLSVSDRTQAAVRAIELGLLQTTS